MARVGFSTSMKIMVSLSFFPKVLWVQTSTRPQSHLFVPTINWYPNDTSQVALICWIVGGGPPVCPLSWFHFTPWAEYLLQLWYCQTSPLRVIVAFFLWIINCNLRFSNSYMHSTNTESIIFFLPEAIYKLRHPNFVFLHGCIMLDACNITEYSVIYYVRN